MKVTLIAAVDDRIGIGKDNQIAWQNDEDMKHFSSYTEGKVVVMGRKTWDSLPVKLLPRRGNWVLTESGGTKELIAMANSNDNFMCSDLDYLLEMIRYRGINVDEICIIGGQSIYEQFMPHATDLVITRIKGDYQCDRFFPEIDLKVWHRYDIDVKDTCRIEYYKRNG